MRNKSPLKLVEQFLNNEFEYGSESHYETMKELAYSQSPDIDDAMRILVTQAKSIATFKALDFMISEMGDRVYKLWDELVALKDNRDSAIRYRISWMLCYYGRTDRDYLLLLNMLLKPNCIEQDMALVWLFERIDSPEKLAIVIELAKKETRLTKLTTLSQSAEYDFERLLTEIKVANELDAFVLYKIALQLSLSKQQCQKLVEASNSVVLFDYFYRYLDHD